MSDPNPYEPPKEPEPLKTAQLVKRGSLRNAVVAIGWIAVTLAMYRLLPIPITNIHLWWFATTIFVSWIGIGLAALSGRNILVILGGLVGALLGFGFGFLSVQ